jgi:hypothetical protein
MTLFSTIEGLIRSTGSLPLLQTDAPYTATAPLQLYLPKTWLLTQLTRTVRDMTANLKAAKSEGLLPQEALDEVQAEIDRRGRFIAQLRADTSTTEVYFAMHPTSEFGDDPEPEQSWN